MALGLVTKNAGRLRPILMTIFALLAGMLPVAIGQGEGAEFYRSLVIAIIGGTITSTLLTLVVAPTFYDSIEITHDRAIAKFHARAARGNALIAFVQPLLEGLLALLLLRWGIGWRADWFCGAGHVLEMFRRQCASRLASGC